MLRYLDSGGDPNVRTPHSLLDIAANSGYLDVAKILVSRGVDVNGFDDGTPLYWAIVEKQYPVALFLIESGADVNKPKSGGWTPLDAVSYDSPAEEVEAKRVIDALVTRGAVGTASNSPSQSSVNVASSDSVPAPTVRVGDTYTYETLDQVEPKLNNVTTREIVDVSSNGFVMAFVNAKSKYSRRLSYDNNLNLMSTRSGDNDGMNYSPALQYFKFPLKTGDTWSSSSTETNIKTGKTRTHTLRGSVGGLEQVTVPAGTFGAFRITMQSELNDAGQISTGQDISWYSPDVRRTVMSELESRDPTGKIGRRRVNLISYRLQ